MPAVFAQLAVPSECSLARGDRRRLVCSRQLFHPCSGQMHNSLKHNNVSVAERWSSGESGDL
jgi:hypothetical protein